ncbi:MAG: cell division protein ZapA [Oligoflexia bacterium]|nr:cell division protein ZapA [Oligoflexia bacterium]MBF0364745.1 cell division protein ZapA [Oligoflexia bacterium]
MDLKDNNIGSHTSASIPDSPQEFEILGLKVRFKATKDETVDVNRVVDLISFEIDEIKKHSPQLDGAQIALLAALKLANDKVALEDDFRCSIERVSDLALSVRRMIDVVGDEGQDRSETIANHGSINSNSVSSSTNSILL